MRLFVTGGDTVDPGVVTQTLDTIVGANKWALASVILDDVRRGVGLAAADWAKAREVRVVETTDFLSEKPDAAVLFPGPTHRAFRALLTASVPVYRVTPEGRYTRYGK